MKVLVLGATGATGKRVVKELIKRNIPVKILIREQSNPPAEIIKSSQVELIRGNVSEYSTKKMQDLLKDCDAAVSCLGHNITFKGMFGHPRKLVSDAVETLCHAINSSGKKCKLILMSTSGYTNINNKEQNSFGEKIVNGILKLLLPPHRDNLRAGDYLTKEIGNRSTLIEWAAVRPDSLIESDSVSEYDLANSPLRSPIFDAGKTSRINVAHFIAELLTNEPLWNKWQYKTPVIYNR